jgi:hypothetical protein
MTCEDATLKNSTSKYDYNPEIFTRGKVYQHYGFSQSSVKIRQFAELKL